MEPIQEAADHDIPITPQPPRSPARHEKLDALDDLVGVWTIESRDLGEQAASLSTLTRRWMPGGYFLIQETRTPGQEDPSIEYIGYDYARQELRSMLFGPDGPGPFCSFALEYVWERDGDDLTIWHGTRGSPAYFTGRIDRTAGTVTGQWHWPGGGYLAKATRVE